MFYNKDEGLECHIYPVLLGVALPESHTRCYCYFRSWEWLKCQVPRSKEVLLLHWLQPACCPQDHSLISLLQVWQCVWLVWSHWTRSWKHGLLSPSVWWWVERLFLLRGGKVFKLVCFLVKEVWRAPENILLASPWGLNFCSCCFSKFWKFFIEVYWWVTLCSFHMYNLLV